ncbi:type II toxin-antitoxin system death-on-curing family toxin [Deinococcus psychrotolerans]|uniref:Type II toxin-antitoxin system death-on-curing family toxin n=2 Tax=Deinococcus psychrotolerans TaxID=2489213 RepID=A0A3G8YNE6_9DEIO|nr:type II toxin-antitoxin system death-on-curing family toxin [Deinococcus psychrotolerans]
MTSSGGWRMPEGLTLAEVIDLHERQLTRYGGGAGLREPGLLESALAQPTQEIFGQRRFPSVPAQAAAYLYYVSRAHAFIDANKRTALSCALVWLAMHDLRLTLSLDDLFDLTLNIAQGRTPLEEAVSQFEVAAQTVD